MKDKKIKNTLDTCQNRMYCNRSDNKTHKQSYRGDTMKKEFVLGYMPTRRVFFSKEESFKEKTKTLAAIKNLIPNVKIVDLEFLNEEGLLITEDDALAVAKKFIAEEVDAVFAPHCNFGCEGAVAIAARAIRKPLLIWAPRDAAPEPDGSRLRDSQCGLFATSKVLQRFGVKFTYILTSHVTDEVFKKGFLNFIAAANVLKKFRNARIGQIGSRPRDFYSVIANESELLEKFGISVIPVDPSAIYRDVRSRLASPDAQLKDAIELVKSTATFAAGQSDDVPQKLAALYVAIKNWAASENVSAASIQCWDSMQQEIGICPCYINSLLADEMFPIGCEADIPGTISSLMLQSAQFDKEPVFLADLTIRHPEDDNAELLWHCGPFPASLAKGAKRVGNHFVLPSHAPGVCDWELKDGHLSLVRFDSINGKYSLFSGEGDVVKGPYNLGTYCYVKVADWPLWERKLIEGPYIHHIAGAYGSTSSIFYEACKYEDELAFDPATPSLNEIKQNLEY